MATSKKEKVLKKAQNLFQYSKESTIRTKWLENYKMCRDYYDGNQWLDENYNKSLDEIKAKRYTFNHVERIINLYTSLQIRSGKRSGFGVKNNIKNNQEVVRALKEHSYLIQTESDYSYYSSRKFTDMLIGGIGWSTYQNIKSNLQYRSIAPEQMYFDPDDKSLKLDNSSFIARSYFEPLHNLLNKYPAKQSFFNDLLIENKTNNSEIADYNSEELWVKGKTIRVVEVEYKKLETCYIVKLIEKEREYLENFRTRTFKTFNIKEIDLIDSSQYHIEVTEDKATAIYKVVYCNDTLLEHRKIDNQVPDQQNFSYIPVMLRRDSDNIPYGIINMLIPLQDSRNYLWSSILHYMDSKTLVVNLAKNVNFNDSISEDMLRRELKVKNGIIFTKTGQDYQILDHNNDIKAKLAMLDKNSQEFEILSGLFNNELSGSEKKNLSGVAINMRTINEMNAQNHILLAYDSMLISEGRNLLNVLQGIEDLNIEVRYKKFGNELYSNIDFEYKTFSFDVFPDTTSNFTTSSEEDKMRFNDLLSSPNATLLLSSKVYLEAIGFNENKAHELVEEFERLNGKQQEQQEQQEQQ